MKRRDFLSGAASAVAAAWFSRSAFAAGDDSMPMHDMSKMNGMASMSGMHDAMQGSELAPVDALPAGAPLASLRTLVNESRTPGEFRATLLAQPVARALVQGQRDTVFWQFDGGLAAAGKGDTSGPVVGPLIALREGDRVEIRVVNRLEQPTTMHWHGLPVPPDQDGNPSNPIPPGGEHVYRFTLPKGSAGTYWYHPHPHMQTAEQVFRGLAGPIVVRAADDPLAAWPERHLFVSDLKLAADASIAPNSMMDWMNGREGQFVLVNGAREPRIEVVRDERWRVWNACSARYLQLAFDDGRAFAQVGTDGGLLAAPRDGLTALVLAPGERAELIVRAGQGASQARWLATQYDRHKMAMSHGSLPPGPNVVLADVRFAPGADASRADASGADKSAALPASLRAIAPLGPARAQKSVGFSEAMDMHAMHQPGASTRAMPLGMKFMINGETYVPGRATLTSWRGDVENWTIANGTDMDHPFHLHGTQFQVLSRESDGRRIAEPYLAWRDTINVRPGEIVHIATVQHEAGDRMFHCHILEHEDLGMMGTLRVI
ncbi:multicopper oxidase family protein [Paraburkholderia tropica]|uniref:Bilirubin oxidase n=1 Tax=Paraburkholderia tropica TaxID=92647 RepID=A0AAQ1JUN1_9BURK|nr:multicopper oxidase family protein [Paraburkholderia tropica]RQN41102.1 multicopper oxidase family protein [Paraburkholderia tropica]SEJ79896.1 bilirubin oxidase [Paraburkholderia tropica]